MIRLPGHPHAIRQSRSLDVFTFPCYTSGMEKKINSTMVAKAAGVAQSTVSLVMNNSVRVADETRRKVIETARRLGYPPALRGRRLTIGVVISRTRPFSSWQLMTLSAMKEEIYRRAFRMEIISNEDIPLLNDRVVSGAISITSDPLLNEKWARMKNIPLVRLNGFPDHAGGIYRVATDAVSDIGRLYEVLYAAGHREIGLFLNKTPEEESHEGPCSSEAFRLLAGKYGISEPERLISFRDRRSPAARLRNLLRRGVTGIIAVPGETAMIVSRELCRMGLRIPEDVSLVTIEYTGVCENWNPPLTALARDCRALCVNALNLLENVLRHQGEVRDILIPGHLIRRESVAAPLRGGRGTRN